jgi:hypothetical protein
MNNEDALKEADYREAESTCPLCGGKPTRFLERPNECGACWLPVGQTTGMDTATDILKRLKPDEIVARLEEVDDEWDGPVDS